MAEEFEPVVGAALDQFLLRASDGVKRAAVTGGGACFDLDKEENIIFSCDDIDLATLGVLEVTAEDFVTGGLEVAGSHFFSEEADFLGAEF